MPPDRGTIGSGIIRLRLEGCTPGTLPGCPATPWNAFVLHEASEPPARPG